MGDVKKEARQALEALGINLNTLVVRSQPFGELIDSETRQVFTPPLGNAAYAICHALKALRQPDTSEGGGEVAEQKRYLKDGPVLRLVRLRFFRDLIQSERVKVYEAFGIDKDNLPSPLTLGIEQHVFNQLFVRTSPPPVTPSPNPEHVEGDVLSVGEMEGGKGCGYPCGYDCNGACFMTTSEPMWNEEATAPRDGTILRLLVEPDPDAHTSFEDSDAHYETIGFNQMTDTGEDEWQFAGWDWSHDCITQGHGKVLGWFPFTLSTAQSSIQRAERERDEARHDNSDLLAAADADAFIISNLAAQLEEARKVLEPFASLPLAGKNRHFVQILVCPEGDDAEYDYAPKIRAARSFLASLGEKQDAE